MIVSTRGRYAIRVLIELAENRDKGYVPMREIAKKQGISLKYLERILPVLTKNGYIEGIHGRGGGYRLVKEPNEYIIGDLLRLTEGSLAPVACLEKDAPKCKNAEKCPTLKMWSGLNDLLNDYFDNITLESLLK
ncbi:MAG: Rrf2 family transcriptional regulator [Clostridia bacterium]|nr:Rrf2 family transcriptional regulator [Clostridia bacterium]